VNARSKHDPGHGAGRDLHGTQAEAIRILTEAKVAPRPPAMLPRQPIVGLFDARVCRRCNARFDPTVTDSAEHRRSHEEMDAYHASLGSARDRALFGSDERPTRSGVRVRSSAPKRRRTNAELVNQVRDLAERGLRPWPIAATLNISERRVKRILSANGANRHQLPLGQAKHGARDPELDGSPVQAPFGLAEVAG
jgi:hypothetical protein